MMGIFLAFYGIGLKNKKIIIKNMDKLSRADLAAYQRILIEKAARHTIQLYRFSSTENPDVIKPQPLASGIVISFKSEYYLVTAKHVCEEEDLTKIGCFVKGQPKLIGCNTVCCCGDDVAYTSLSENIIDVLSNEKIIPYKLEESIGVSLIYETNRYMLYGYPASMVKDTADKEVRIVKTSPLFTKILGKDNINRKRICLKSENMFAVDFHKDKLASFSTETPMKQLGPKPGGLSGCGLWQFDAGKLILVGIMTDYDIPKAVLLGEMINSLIESINKRSITDVIDSASSANGNSSKPKSIENI